MDLTTTLKIMIRALLVGTADLSSPVDDMNITRTTNLTHGTGAGKADASFHDGARALADGISEEFLLNAGTVGGADINDGLGNNITFTKLKLLYIKNHSSTEDATLNIGGSIANAVNIFADDTDILVLNPDGEFLWFDPAGIDVSVDEKLTIEHGGEGTAGLTYDIIMVGED